VPWAVFGDEELMGIMRCGNWYSPLRLVGHKVLWVEVVDDEVWVVVEAGQVLI
jgi:hypothetical protein